ncbi:MAG: hypothetical protein U0930_04860 [Pirellulales bacterium]
MADYVVIPGKFDIYVACNFPWTVGGTAVSAQTPMKLGELADELYIPLEQDQHPVPGDRNGGREGDPIEEQFLSQTARFELELSQFDPEVAAALQTAGGLLTTPGTIPQNVIGALLRQNRSYRFAFRPIISTSTRSRNFPCVMVRRAHILGGGTKFEMFRGEFSAHRAPPGHWGGTGASSKPNVLFDTDMTGLPALS